MYYYIFKNRQLEMLEHTVTHYNLVFFPVPVLL